MQHKVHIGPSGGKFQTSHRKDRYLLEQKKVKTGPQGGHFQSYGKAGKKKRYLLD